MEDRTCEEPTCNKPIMRRRGNPAKRCRDHIGRSRCFVCGGEIAHSPRGQLPSYCSRKCSHASHRAKLLTDPEALAADRRRAREAARFDMHCVDCAVLIPRVDVGRRNVRCDPCQSAKMSRKWRRQKFHRYGITEDQYDAMLLAQGGGCAFCGAPQGRVGANNYDFHIDHDHACCPHKGRSCGRCVRFLLCDLCNIGLGYFREDPSIMRTAADAIEARQPLAGATT